METNKLTFQTECRSSFSKVCLPLTPSSPSCLGIMEDTPSAPSCHDSISDIQTSVNQYTENLGSVTDVEDPTSQIENTTVPKRRGRPRKVWKLINSLFKLNSQCSFAKVSLPLTPSSPSCLGITEERTLCEVRSPRRYERQSKMLTPVQKPVENDGATPVASRCGRDGKTITNKNESQSNVVAVKVKVPKNVL